MATLYDANTERIQSLIGVVFSLVIHEVSLDITGGSCAYAKRQLSVAYSILSTANESSPDPGSAAQPCKGAFDPRQDNPVNSVDVKNRLLRSNQKRETKPFQNGRQTSWSIRKHL